MSGIGQRATPYDDPTVAAEEAAARGEMDGEAALPADAAAVAGRVIEALAGPGARLRADQQQAVAALLAPAARVLVVQATGWGKSAVYWTASAILRSRGSGPTLVVSPLLSLMRDQVAAARGAGLSAATLNSTNREEWEAIEAALLAGQLDVLLVSPERLAHPGFGHRVLDALAGRMGLLVIDEAHSVSDWGHDFRPDYRRVADVLRSLNPTTPVLATTATANERVTADVARQLGAATLVQRGRLARNSLDLAVVPGLDPLSRYAWVVEHLPVLPGSGIVYALTVADAQRLAAAITARHGADLPVAAYTGALEGEERARLEDDLRFNRVKALVATSALGMGYDKPDLGFVVHLGAPPSPVSYYQQVGRAGRAIERAVVALLPAEQDERIWDYFATASLPDPAEVTRLLAVLPGPGEPATSVPRLEAESGLRRTKVELLLKQLAVDGVTARDLQGWRGTGDPWVYDAEHYAGILATRRREASIMREYVAGRSCLMALLQQALDDPTAAPCGRCSACRDTLPPEWSAHPTPEAVEFVRGRLRGQTHVLEPRKMWPGGAFGRSGRIPAELAVEEGRVLVHADAPEWAQVRAALLEAPAAGEGARERLQELAETAVATLTEWRKAWAARPDLVVSLAAAGLQEVAEGVARHLGAVGRLPVAAWAWGGEPPGRDLTSASEAAHWRDVLADSAVPDVVGRVVLLVVDASASCWAVTVAGAELRAAGADRVLPLLVHRRV